MDGKVLLDIYENTPSPITRIPSWDNVDGDHGMHPPDKQISAEDSKAALDQLVALGYIDEPDTDQSKAMEQTVRELEYNLAQAWKDGGIYTEAICILERLYDQWPLEHRFGFQLATCYDALGRTKELREIISTVIARRLEEAKQANKELIALNLDNEDVQKEEKEYIEALDVKGQKKHFKERKDLIRRAQPNLFALRYYEATADFAEKDYIGALDKLQELEGDFGPRQTALVLRGECYSRLQKWDQAVASYEKLSPLTMRALHPSLGSLGFILHGRTSPQPSSMRVNL